jgi:glycosyltransferase involved in cell wall biosynthesis
MTTVHLVYPHGPRISTPDAIGRKLGERLRRHYPVVHHEWDAHYAILPQPGDVLLGHAHPAPWSCFRRSLKRPGWRRVIAMQPYNHGDLRQIAFLDSVLDSCDLFLAITGHYWYDSAGASLCSHWRPKMIHLDLAVDRQEFPVLKTAFNTPGSRRFVYIGHAGWTKNTAYLSRIAEFMPEITIFWIGPGRPSAIPGVQALGAQEFSTREGRGTLAVHDFMVTVGRADANPTTVLEAMAWGLIPVCTPQSGYAKEAGIVNIPLDDHVEAVRILRQLQAAPEAELRELQAHNWRRIDEHFNWDRFAGQVIAAIEGESSPALGTVSTWRRVRLRWLALLSPHFPWWPLNLARFVGRNVHRRLKAV